MKLTVCAAAAALLMQSAYADPAHAASGFRAPAPQSFSSEDIARYGLDADTLAKADAYRKAGYKVVAMTPAELAADKAGLSSTTWIIIGVLAVVVIAVAASGGGGGGY